MDSNNYYQCNAAPAENLNKGQMIHKKFYHEQKIFTHESFRPYSVTDCSIRIICESYSKSLPIMSGAFRYLIMLKIMLAYDWTGPIAYINYCIL